MPASSPTSFNESFVDVWAYNLDKEFEKIREIILDYHYVALDTEYPGVVARPIGEFRSSADYQYQIMRCNVDILRIIQVGMTFFNDEGQTPNGVHTFQFHFKFNLSQDMFAQDSIELLTNAGIQFDRHDEQGIEPVHFAELLITSGLVLCDDVRWISFQGGYDFGYLVKSLVDIQLPKEEGRFLELYKHFFPCAYDVKYLMKSVKNLKGGLQDVATSLELERIGPQHQAGSDSLLTGAAFFKMKQLFFDDKIDDNKYCGHVIGLGTSFFNGSLPYGSTQDSSAQGTT